MTQPASEQSSEQSLAASYFDGVYRSSDDPWCFRSSAYEHRKYQRTLAALPRTRFERAVEIGCSIGVLTRQLAPRCGQLLALDVNEAALRIAQGEEMPGDDGGHPIEWQQMQLPQQFPTGRFDLIMLSEVGYYWSLVDLQRVADWAAGALQPEGAVVLVHWTDPVHDYPLTGDQVHSTFIDMAAQGRLRRRYGEWHPRYRIDVFDAAGAAPPADEAP